MELTVKVHVDAGCDIQKAATQACRLADRIGIDVEFQFNGVTCVAMPNASESDLVVEYYREQNSGREHKMAFARTRKPPELQPTPTGADDKPQFLRKIMD